MIEMLNFKNETLSSPIRGLIKKGTSLNIRIVIFCSFMLGYLDQNFSLELKYMKIRNFTYVYVAGCRL